MKKIENILLKSCAFTVLISALFFAFAKMTSRAEVKIGFTHFFIIFLFGIAISIANLVLEYDKLHVALRMLIHYVVLLIAFSVVFINMGNIAADGASAIFTTVFIFTFLYVFISLISYSIKKLIVKLDKRFDKKHTAPQKEKETYQPRFKA